MCYPILDIPNLGLLPETCAGLVFEFVPFHDVQIRLKFAIFQVTIPLKTLCRLDVSNLAVHINRFVIEDENCTIISPDCRGMALQPMTCQNARRVKSMKSMIGRNRYQFID